MRSCQWRRVSQKLVRCVLRDARGGGYVRQGKWFFRFLASFFAPIDVFIDGILKSKAERLHGLSPEENQVFDVGNASFKEVYVFVIVKLSDVAFVFHSHLLI
jgi:hypothetical protein